MFPLRLSVAAIGLWLCTVAAVSAAATTSILRADHPQNYTVQQGDTLWDISARFLDKPWQWPAIWHVNPQVENPHLIYPGDRLKLVYQDGQPRLMVDRDKPVKRLSPQTYVTQRSAISALLVQMFEVALPRRICCSRACSVNA